MVQYFCHRCGYTTHHKNTFKKHLKRKNLCSPLLSEISISEIAEMNKILDSEMGQMLVTQNTHKITRKLPEKGNILVTQNYPKITRFQNSKKSTCKYCKKQFTSKNSCYRHQKHYCKKRPQNDLVVFKSKKTSEVEELKKKVANLEKLLEKGTSNKIIQNAEKIENNQTNNQTIVINNYGSENLEYITKKYISELIKSGPFASIPKLMNKIHFDKKHPENHTVAITNIKSKYGSIRKDDRWQVMLIKDLLEDILINKFDFLDEMFPTISEDLPEFKKNCYKDFTNKISCDPEVRAKLENDLYLVILNSTKGLGLKIK